MRDHNHAVARHCGVQFECRYAEFHRQGERGQGVFRRQSARATMALQVKTSVVQWRCHVVFHRLSI